MDGKTVYIKVHAPWEVLANGAEEIMLRMPTIVSQNFFFIYFNRLNCIVPQCAILYYFTLLIPEDIPCQGESTGAQCVKPNTE
jgi:hypothetical protein